MSKKFSKNILVEKKNLEGNKEGNRETVSLGNRETAVPKIRGKQGNRETAILTIGGKQGNADFPQNFEHWVRLHRQKHVPRIPNFQRLFPCLASQYHPKEARLRLFSSFARHEAKAAIHRAETRRMLNGGSKHQNNTCCARPLQRLC